MPVEIGELVSQGEAPSGQPGAGSPQRGGSSPSLEITDELVQAIADLVYARLLFELKVERERYRWSSNSSAERKRAGRL